MYYHYIVDPFCDNNIEITISKNCINLCKKSIGYSILNYILLKK